MEGLPTEAEGGEPLPELPEPEPSGERPLANKLRELAELRDSGLITDDEHDAKRRDLLDSM